jgi:quercetin dioxygenase-like cupin family protein
MGKNFLRIWVDTLSLRWRSATRAQVDRGALVTENEVVIPADMEMCATHVDDAEIIQGRRTFFVYRDFGVEHASKGLIRVQTITAKAAMDKATGWHYHACGAQLIYVISGWVELSFEDGKTRRMSGGDVFFLPGGYVHNELTASEDYSALEVVVPGAVDAPGEMNTTACEAPASFMAEASVS